MEMYVAREGRAEGIVLIKGVPGGPLRGSDMCIETYAGYAV